eukprot:TRINITY_DN26056_c0_g1_i1.p1 TRINITY_DN26056_c0_g1~~TRINITY_DN26056_c0_g1_i1.p1  ORF type:complete len:161 (+),score=19.82 TRINITY_DN26056_c0_g1_i1:83-565(+)
MSAIRRALINQRRWASVPRSREHGARHGKANIKYISYRSDRIRNEAKGLSPVYGDDMLPSGDTDSWEEVKKLSVETHDGLERFPWEQYSKTVSCVIVLGLYSVVISFAALTYKNSLNQSEHELSSVDNKLRLITKEYHRLKNEHESVLAEVAHYRELNKS